MGTQLVAAEPLLVFKTMVVTNSTTPQRRSEVVDSVDPKSILDTLNDAGCRAILEATAEEMLTATELSERCAIPMSTAYRKVEKLADAGLLEERIRINTSSKHATEYRKCFGGVLVSVDGGDLDLEVLEPAREGEKQCRSNSVATETENDSDSGFPYAVADD